MRSKILKLCPRLYDTLKNRNFISSWSPLGLAFNTNRTNNLNLNIMKNNTGLFGWDQLQTPDGFYLLQDNCIDKAYTLINEVCSERRNRNMVEIFDEMSNTLCQIADMAEFIRLAHPDSKFSRAAEDAHINICGTVDRLNTHRKLYDALQTITVNGDIFPMTDLDRHVTNLFVFDFEQCGIHLQEEDRQLAVSLNDYILQNGQRFVAGTVSPRIVSKEFVPHTLSDLLSFPSQGTNFQVSSLYADSGNQFIREMGYKLFLLPDAEQDFLLDAVLSARHRLAQLCGFPTYCHRAVNGSIVESPEFILQFLNILNERLRSRAEIDFKTMSLMKSHDCSNDCRKVECWDTYYYTNKVKKKFLGGDSSEFAPYFSLGSCMEGLNILFDNLYGIKLVHVDPCPGELWFPDVYKLEVVHETEGLLGFIYCDFYEREKKSNQDCHYTIQGGKLLKDGNYQKPIVVVMLNLPSPRWSRPALLTPGMVDTLFHEMGHAMHSMLGRTRYQHVTGTRCSTDFAEVPSILMEYFSSDPRVLSLFAKHFQTQDPMPEEMVSRLCASKQLFSASETQTQLFYSALDHHYHSGLLKPGETTQVLEEIQKKYYSLPYVPNTAWQLRFSHLIGYGARYYSYLISKAVASWIWQAYFSKEPLNRESGERFRSECLTHGGGKPPRKMVADLLKKEITPYNLVESLILEVDMKQTCMMKFNFHQ